MNDRERYGKNMYKRVFVNQCGYLPQMDKKVTFCSDSDVSFSVLKSDGTSVFRGKATARIDNPSAKEKIILATFHRLKSLENIIFLRRDSVNQIHLR